MAQTKFVSMAVMSEIKIRDAASNSEKVFR